MNWLLQAFTANTPYFVSLVFGQALAAEQRDNPLVVFFPTLPLRRHLLHRVMNVGLVHLQSSVTTAATTWGSNPHFKRGDRWQSQNYHSEQHR